MNQRITYLLSLKQRFLYSIAFLMIFSCTIIKDEDITDPTQTSKLKLKSIEIKQSLNSGDQTSLATVTLNSSGQIEKINWPALGNKKLKFRSGFTSAATSTLSYTGGKLTTFDTQSGLEKYVFEYNGAGNLVKLISTGTFANNIVKTIDTLYYDTQNRITRLERSLFNGAGVKTQVSINPITYLGDGTLDAFSYNGKPVKQDLGQGYCENDKSTINCTRYDFGTGGPNQGFPTVLFKRELTGTLIDKIEFADNRTGGGNSGNDCYDCNRELDEYYIHPMMMLKSYFNNGDDLFVVYMIDWWITGSGTPTTNIKKNDIVNFNFNYGL